MAALERGVRVPGRFEPVDEGQDFAVLVDYAHTPDSLENVLRAARELIAASDAGGGRVLCVFGAGGDRDRGKRPLMGEIAARLADVVLVTSDNPRSEDPEQIIAEIMAGRRAPARRAGVAGRTGVARSPIAARRSPQASPRRARATCVVIAGKGHEQGQEFAGGRKLPFDDVAVAGRGAARARAQRPGRGSAPDEELGRASASPRAAGAGAAARRPRAGAPGRARAGRSSTRATLGPGSCSSGCAGERADGGAHAAQALRAGAWGVLVGPEHAAARRAPRARAGAVLAHPDPLAGLQALARAWRARAARRRGAASSRSPARPARPRPRTSSPRCSRRALRTVASPENHNTEIGLPLALLAAPAGTEVLVLEMAMRGPGQIAELTAIAEPDVGVIVNVGPAHLELLGSLEAIAAAKAELIAGLAPGATRRDPGRRAAARSRTCAPTCSTITLRREGGDVDARRARGPTARVVIARPRASTIALRPVLHARPTTLSEPARRRGRGAGARRHARRARWRSRFSAHARPARSRWPAGWSLIDDCYNANPMSMRAAIDDLAASAPARRVAVLGDMLELGPQAPRLHREIGRHAGERGVELLVTVGPLAAEMRAGASAARATPHADARRRRRAAAGAAARRRHRAREGLARRRARARRATRCAGRRPAARGARRRSRRGARPAGGAEWVAFSSAARPRC